MLYIFFMLFFFNSELFSNEFSNLINNKHFKYNIKLSKNYKDYCDISYYTNGNIKSIYCYSNFNTISFKYFDYNGNILSKGYINNKNKFIDTYSFYDEEGIKIYDIVFDKNQIIVYDRFECPISIINLNELLNKLKEI